MNKDSIKKKTDIMKTIMGNPKLASSFRDAMSAPIGSTKRDQAKTVISIMNKLGGVRNDGSGGPITDMIGQNNQNNTAPLEDYSNMMIFPAAPKFKNTPTSNQTTITKTSNAFDGTGGPYDGKGGSLDNFDQMGYSVQPNEGSIITPSSYSSSVYNTNLPPPPVSSPSNPPSSTSSSGYSLPTIPAPSGVSNTSSSDTSNASPAVLADSTITPSSTDINNGTDTSKTSTIPPSTLTSADITGSAEKAIKAGTGPATFAKGIADEKFGGGLDTYINNLDHKLKSDFGLADLEKSLTKLKNEKTNLIPTLTQYIQGKDQYLGLIDNLIQDTEGNLKNVDMSDPVQANSYNNTINYLYTLKGRQTQRYGNFLNSAIADYNADLDKTQNNYDTVYKNYSDTMTRTGTMAQNEYNTLYTSMADLYNNLEQAPVKALNLETMQQQAILNNLVIANNGINGGYSFTKTQSNKGADNAGLKLPDFKTLDPEVQNFFVNISSTQAKDITSSLEQVKKGSISTSDAKTAIDDLGLSDSISTYLKQRIDENAPLGGSAGGGWWSKFSNWFNGGSNNTPTPPSSMSGFVGGQ